ncbi:hypothetical protein BLNAU_19360 [Blattamonas nauphoetae]|uniref:Uncharacterized protein n=1 Tax=Blattamonas nauphoetae TaxID=2049346 RepID=A0ABQ9WKL1_9EUKA|nr:hypothetical protein BLNAU_25099 [Blattamonas nauphoetae]KAK2945691.1 hypothetical protein BLNAU_19360 [Blattamonas nauphoetae]
MMFEIPNLVSVLFHDSYLSLHSVSASLLFKSSLFFLFVADSALPYPHQAAFGMCSGSVSTCPASDAP